MRKFVISSLVAMVCICAAAQTPQTMGPINVKGNANISGTVAAGTTNSVTTNGELNAALFPGADIGAKTNAAIAALGSGGGTVLIPAGSYTYSTTITVPHGLTLTGQGDATILHWSGAHAAIVAAQSVNVVPVVFGEVANLRIVGTSTSGQVGVYEGGDPNNVYSASTLFGYGYILRNVRVSAMDNGIYWGSNTYQISWYEVSSTNNLKYGWYYPATSTVGGQDNHFYSSHLSNNPSGAFFVAQPPQVTFSMYGMDIEYNGSQINSAGPFKMQGGNYQCFDCHIEDYFGPFVTVGGNSGSASFYGGLIAKQGSTTDPYLFYMTAGRSAITLDAVQITLNGAVTNLITQAAGGANDPTVSFDHASVIDSGYYLKSVTDLVGAGITWCLPYDDSSGAGPVRCSNGNTYGAGNGVLATPDGSSGVAHVRALVFADISSALQGNVAIGGVGAWSQTTPAPTCSAGSPTTLTSTVRVQILGKSAFLSVIINDVTNGTCAGQVNVALPIIAKSFSTLSCYSYTGGLVVSATGSLNAGTSALSTSKYDSTTWATTGGNVTCSGVIETQ